MFRAAAKFRILVAAVAGAVATLLILGGIGGPPGSPGAIAAAVEGDPVVEVGERPKVVVIGTGGTIAGVSATRTSFQDYRGAQLLIENMVGELRPEIEEFAEVSTIQFGNKGSGAWTLPEFHDLTSTVDAALVDADAVVVTTGTDTMEEFAYWLDLTVRSAKPVVLTGSMRPWTVIGSDAQANLYNAIVLAASGKTTCYGSVLMLNDEFHAARDVTKTNALRMDTFQSREVGVLGVVDDGQVRAWRAPARVEACGEPEWATPFDLDQISRESLPRVEIVVSYQDAGGEAISGFAAAGVDGIVTAGTGAGGISSAMSAARRDAVAAGVVFVSTTRTGSGSTYGGGEGIVPGEDLLPQKARLLLLLSLALTKDVEQVGAWFTAYGMPEFDTADDLEPAMAGAGG